MNKITAFIVVVIVVGLGYWSYNSSVKNVSLDTGAEPVLEQVVSTEEAEVDLINIGDDSGADLQQIDTDLNTL